jgi:Arc/MetJ-type ribon-helix-helix transcriptional regulator
MIVIIPDSFHEFLAEQIASGMYADENELICALLKKEQMRKERESVDQKLLEALDSPTTEMTKPDWDELRAEVERRHAARSGVR